MKFYQEDHKFPDLVKKYKTVISISDDDTLKAAVRMGTACCLNFASHKRPGGGYKAVWDIPMPIKTQEEDLFRRSNLPGLMDVTEITKHYPLKGIEGFYTDNIIVNKDDKLQLIEPFKITMVTVPAVVNPRPDQAMLVIRKVERILNIAAENNEKDLVLGAWGCGIFANDPKTIAELFYNFLKTSFDGVFERVVFAIPNKTHANYLAFESIIEL